MPPEANLWCEPKAFVESGNAADKILEQAEELGIDLIVLGIRHVSTSPGTRTHLGMATAYKVVSRRSARDERSRVNFQKQRIRVLAIHWIDSAADGPSVLAAVPSFSNAAMRPSCSAP